MISLRKEARRRFLNRRFDWELEGGTGVSVLIDWKREITGRQASIYAERRKRRMSPLHRQRPDDQPTATNETRYSANQSSLENKCTQDSMEYNKCRSILLKVTSFDSELVSLILYDLFDLN